MEAAKSQQQNCQDLHMPKKQRIPILFSLFFFQCVKVKEKKPLIYKKVKKKLEAKFSVSNYF